MAETSNEVSTLAGRYAKYDKAELQRDVAHRPTELAHDIRSMAASLLRQDETKGLRGIVNVLFGRKDRQNGRPK